MGLGESGETTQLWIRRWADLDATPIRGTEGASTLVLSPDALPTVDVRKVVGLSAGRSEGKTVAFFDLKSGRPTAVALSARALRPSFLPSVQQFFG